MVSSHTTEIWSDTLFWDSASAFIHCVFSFIRQRLSPVSWLRMGKGGGTENRAYLVLQFLLHHHCGVLDIGKFKIMKDPD